MYSKIRPQSRYFPYTRPLITDEDFQPERDPHLTGDEARAIDSAIDAYNETIIDSVAAARRDGLDWYLFDLGALLDRLAIRRYIESPWARPSWWTPYELPEQLRALDPVPNTRFFRAGREGRTDGGLFSLDGVHPTNHRHGVLAQEVLRVMELAGVTVLGRDGKPRESAVVDFDRVLAADTLLRDPPAAVSETLSLLGWLMSGWTGSRPSSRSRLRRSDWPSLTSSVAGRILRDLDLPCRSLCPGPLRGFGIPSETAAPRPRLPRRPVAPRDPPVVRRD